MVFMISLSTWYGIFGVVSIISAFSLLFSLFAELITNKNKLFNISLASFILFAGLFFYVDKSIEKTQIYVEIHRINDTQYTQCLNGVQYLISTNNSIVMLDPNNKPIQCVVQYFTYDEKQSYKSKDFIQFKK